MLRNYTITEEGLKKFLKDTENILIPSLKHTTISLGNVIGRDIEVPVNYITLDNGLVFVNGLGYVPLTNHAKKYVRKYIESSEHTSKNVVSKKGYMFKYVPDEFLYECAIQSDYIDQWLPTYSIKSDQPKERVRFYDNTINAIVSKGSPMSSLTTLIGYTPVDPFKKNKNFKESKYLITPNHNKETK